MRSGEDNRTYSLYAAIIVLSLAAVVLLSQCGPVVTDEASFGLSFYPAPGDYNSSIAVRIDTNIRRAEIHYTTDGTPPTADSPVYRSEIKLTQSSLVQAAVFDRSSKLITGIGAVYLITPGNGKPSAIITSKNLEDSRSRFEAVASDPDGDSLAYRWYVDGRLQPGETEPVFVTDLRADYERTATVSVRVSDGENTVEAVSTVSIAARQAEIDNVLLAGLITRAADKIKDAAPVLRLTAPYGVIDYGESIRLTAEARDPEGGELKYLWLVDDQSAAEGPAAYLDFSKFPEKGRDYRIKVAVSDGQNVTSAALKIFVNEAQPSAVVKNINGKVEVQKYSGEWMSLQNGMALDLSDTVATGFGASAEIQLGDSVITVSPMSRVTLDALSSNGGVQQTSLYMRVGSVKAKVDASEGAHDFKVMAPHATASVRGTEFSFDGLNLRVFEGKVALKIGPPSRNIQRDRQKPREAAEAAGEEESKSDDAADNSAEAEDTSSDEETAEDSSAEDSDAEDSGDEVLVETGESAEVAVTASGEATGISKDTAVAQESGIQEVSIPEFAKLSVQIGFSEAVTTNAIQEATPVMVSVK